MRKLIVLLIPVFLIGCTTDRVKDLTFDSIRPVEQIIAPVQPTRVTVGNTPPEGIPDPSPADSICPLGHLNHRGRRCNHRQHNHGAK